MKERRSGTRMERNDSMVALMVNKDGMGSLLMQAKESVALVG